MKKDKLLLITTTIVGTAATLYGINKMINVRANSNSSIANSNGLIYPWRFGDIFYTKQGNGNPVLLVHDLNCTGSMEEWNSIINSYAKNHTVYAIDLIGCARSEKPSITYTNYLYVQLITDFVKNVIGHRTDVITSGYSSSFVIMACYSDDSLFNRILMINPSNIKGSFKKISNNKKILKKIIECPIIGNTIYNIAFSKKSIVKMLKEKYYHNDAAIKLSTPHIFYDAAHHGNKNSNFLYASLNSNYLTVDLTKAIKEINNSIYIVGGQQEDNIRDTINEYTSLNSSIEVSFVPDTKHVPHLERPSEVLSIMNLYVPM